MSASVAVSRPAQRRQILDQLFHTAALRGLSMGARAATFALVVRILSPADYGWYALINTTLAISVLAGALNFGSYLVRELPGREETTQYGVFRGLIVPLLVGNAFVGVLAATVGRGLLPTRHAHAAELVALIYLFEIVTEQIESFLLGSKQIQKANWVVGARTLGLALFMGGVMLTGWRSLESVFGALLAAEVLAFSVAASWLRWNVLWQAPISPGLWRKAPVYSLPLLAAGLAFMAMKFGDKYLIAHYLDLVSVARYAFAYSMVNMAYGLTVLVSSTVLVPHIMGAENEDDPGSRNRQIVRANKLAVYGLAGAAFAFAVIPSRFWVLFSGHRDYLGVKSLALALTGASLLSVLGNSAHYILLVKKKTTVLALIDIGGVGSIVVLNVLLLPSMGLYGAALSAAISFGASSAVKHLYVWRLKIFDPRDLLDWSDEKWALSQVVRSGL